MSRVTLYVGKDCGLCREARDLLLDAGISFQEAEDPRYVLRVPVAEVDGEVVTEGRISTLAVRRALRTGRRWRPPAGSL